MSGATPSRTVLKLRHAGHLLAGEGEAIDGMIGMPRRFGPRRDVIARGDPPDRLHVIVEGFACRYKVTEAGRRAIVALMLPGDFCDLHVAVLGRMDHSIGTLTECQVADVSSGDVQTLIDSSPTIARTLWWSTLVDEAILRQWLANMGRLRADHHLMHLFCELHLRMEGIGLALNGSFRLPLTQEEIGDVIGVASVHVNRIVQALRADGLVTLQGGRVALPDWDRAVAFAGFDADYLHLKRPGRVAPII